MEWSPELTSAFLDIYQTEPILFNAAKHKHSIEIHHAWQRVKDKMEAVDPSISTEELKRKRDMIMSTYRKLRGKVIESKKSGCAAKDVFKPTWAFYQIVSSFQDKLYVPRRSKKSGNCESSEESSSSEDRERGKRKRRSKGKKSNKGKEKRPKENKVNEPEQEPVECSHFTSMTQDRDECCLYTDLLCKKLRGLEESTRERAMFEINKYMYNLKQEDLLKQNTSGHHSRSHVSLPSLCCLSNPSPIPSYSLQPTRSFQSNPPCIAVHPLVPSPVSQPSIQPKVEKEEFIDVCPSVPSPVPQHSFELKVEKEEPLEEKESYESDTSEIIC